VELKDSDIDAYIAMTATLSQETSSLDTPSEQVQPQENQ